MAKTPRDLRLKSTEPYSNQDTSRRMTEDIMQAAWKDNREAAEDGKERGTACYRNEGHEGYLPNGMKHKTSIGYWTCSRQPSTGQEIHASDERSDS